MVEWCNQTNFISPKLEIEEWTFFTIRNYSVENTRPSFLKPALFIQFKQIDFQIPRLMINEAGVNLLHKNRPGHISSFNIISWMLEL